LIAVASAELKCIIWIIRGVVFLTLGINPDTGPAEAGFEALNADDGKEKPKEANKKRDMYK
jgi:hypothetical protein